MRRIEVLAPAKLNLGLEVVRRRPDGYHDLVTIFQTISLADRLTFTSSPDDRGRTLLEVDDPELEGLDNLVARAIAALRSAGGIQHSVVVYLEKHIPAAAGLGGASSDAAATLRALNTLWDCRLDSSRLHAIAAAIGSDVPFFLTGGTAIATGRGDNIEKLPSQDSGCFVVAVPQMDSPLLRKTAALYAALKPGDMTSGARIREHAKRLRRGEPLAPSLLANAFERALYELRPEVAGAKQHLEAAGAPFAALSGAGPAHYSLLPTIEAAEAVSARLVEDWGSAIAFCTTPSPGLHASDSPPCG